MNRFNWHVNSDFIRDGISIYVVGSDQRPEHLSAALSVIPHEKGDWYDPTFRLTADEAQQLINGLWMAGFRPKDGAGALAHVETLKAHLDDLRTIAFHALNIGSPPKAKAPDK